MASRATLDGATAEETLCSIRQEKIEYSVYVRGHWFDRGWAPVICRLLDLSRAFQGHIDILRHLPLPVTSDRKKMLGSLGTCVPVLG